MSVEIIDNMPFDEYLSLDRLSASSLKNFKKSPAYYMQQKETRREPSKAMLLGTMVHTWMLENSTFQNRYYAMPEIAKPERPEGANGKAKAGTPEKQLYLEYKKEVDLYEDTVQSYVDAAGEREIYPEDVIERFTKLPVRNDTKNEVTVLWEHEGIKCKSRFDMLHENGIEDLKTISNIFNINRDFYNFGYHLQAGFYAQAYFYAFGKWPDFFNFTFVSTDPTYFDMVTCPISFEYLELGRMKALELMKKYQECKESGKYPGISSFEIETPSWL